MIGFRESRMLSRRVDAAERFLSGGKRIAMQSKYCHSLKRELLSELPLLHTDRLAEADRDGIPLLISQSGLPLNREELDMLTDFIFRLGDGTLDEQLNLVQRFTDFWSEVRTAAVESKNSKSRLYLSLGAFAGLAVTILLW